MALVCAPAFAVGCNALLGNDPRSLDATDAATEASLDARPGSKDSADAAFADAGFADAAFADAAFADAGFADAGLADPGPDADAGAPCTATLGSDDENCGACGHSCLGGGCEAGLCGPSLVSKGGRPTAVYVDPGPTGSIIWCDYNGGAVKSVDKVSGAVTTINPAGDRTTGALAVGPQVVFWTAPDANSRDGGILWADRDGDGGAPGFAGAYDWFSPSPMGTDGTYVYWGNRWQRDIWRMDIATKTPQFLGSYWDGGAAPTTGELLYIGVDAVNGYVFYSDGSTLFRMNQDGKNVVVFGPVSGQPNVGPFLVDNGYLYWVSGSLGSIVREKTKSGCAAVECPEIVLKGDNLTAANGLAADDTYLYVADNTGGNVADNTGGKLLRTHKDGSTFKTADVLATIPKGQLLAGIAVDSIALYWAVQFGNGSIWRLAK